MRNSSITPLVRSRTSDSAIERDRHVLEDEREDGRPEEPDDRGLDGAMLSTSASVGAATTSGGIRPASGTPCCIGIGLALLGGPPDDLLVDGAREARGQEARRSSAWTGSTTSTWTSIVDCSPASELLPRRRPGRRRRRRPRPTARRCVGRRLVRHDRRRSRARRRRGPGRPRRRSAGRTAGGMTMTVVERPLEAVVAEPEDGHDQERPEDEAEERARPADDLDELLADEGEEPGDDLGERR